MDLDPRPQFYQFAHRHLPALLSVQAETLMRVIESHGSAFLADEWATVAKSNGRPASGGEALALAAAEDIGGYRVLFLQMPPPERPTEAWFVALALKGPEYRYFVWERTLDNGAKIAEWKYTDGRVQQRIAGARGPDVGLAPFREWVAKWLEPRPAAAASSAGAAPETRARPTTAVPPAASPRQSRPDPVSVGLGEQPPSSSPWLPLAVVAGLGAIGLLVLLQSC